MKRVPFLLLLFVFSFCREAAANPPLRLGLKEALDKNMVAVSATGSGRLYYEKTLTLKVTNKSGSTLMLTMDQGLVFKPQDTVKQDLVLAGAEVLTLAPFKEGAVDVQTFCAKSYGNGPGGNDVYGSPRMGSEKLVKLTQFLKQHYLFGNLGQHAVWVITNNHPLSSVFDPAREAASKKLIEFMAGLMGMSQPDYYTVYAINTEAGRPVFERKVLRILTTFEIKLDEPKKLSLNIYSADGKLVQGVFDNRMFAGKKGHRFRVDFEGKGAPAGKYYIRLKEGDTVLQEKEVVLE